MNYYLFFSLNIHSTPSLFLSFQRVPPMKVSSLMDDLKDGTRLLALLEVLSGEKLPMERGRVLRRPHYLSNCNTALEFLRSKRVSSTVW